MSPKMWLAPPEKGTPTIFAELVSVGACVAKYKQTSDARATFAIRNLCQSRKFACICHR